MKQHFLKKWIQFSGILVVMVGAAIGGASLLGQSETQLSVSSAVSSGAIAQSLAPELRQITSFRSPTCGCCGAWVEQMQAAGFEVRDTVTEEIEGVKRELSVPQELAACHTATVGGYVVEGHIPAADIQKLLTEKPNVVGITVPGMPIGSPGMESGDITEPYQVLTFDQAGQTHVFSDYST